MDQTSDIEHEELPSNTVKFEIYTPKGVDSKIVEECRQFLMDVKHCDSINIDLEGRKNQMRGSYKFDYNVDEEWLVVYCLFELSKAKSDLVIRVHDDDGEILLIEAANHLPRWLESSTSKDRVYIYQGRVHIIPEHIDIKLLNKHDIASIVRDNKTKTLADNSIQKAIQEQLKCMPDKDSWLKRKFSQLDDIITSNADGDEEHDAMKPGNLSLASVMAMEDEDLEISPISSLSASPS